MEAHQMPLETQQQLRRLPGNNRCVDCDAPYPQWATVSYGTFMCLECSGRHRGLGVHISFVRSVTMDSWTDKQVRQMQQGGNDSFREAFAAAGVPKDLSISQKYNTPQAEAYRKRLTALVDGGPAVALPRWDPSSMGPAGGNNASSGSHGSGDDRGMEALKGESEQDYVARQMRLRDEARARMQAKFGANGMQGIGSSGETSAPASSSTIPDLSSAFGYLTTTVTSAASTAASLVKEKDLGSKVSSGWSYVQSTVTDPALTDNVKSTASSGWSMLSTGASAVWSSARTAVDTTMGTVVGSGGSSNTGARSSDSQFFPRTNSSLSTSNKYSGFGSSDAKDHDNDSWLDAQLGAGPTKANSFSGSGSSNRSMSIGSNSTHSSSFTSSSSSSMSFASAPSAPAPAPISTPTPASAPAPLATAPPPKLAAKKDVDFFSEYGF